MVTRTGDDLLSVMAGSPAEAQALAMELRKSGQWLDVVAGIESVVVQFDAAVEDIGAAESRIKASIAGGIGSPQAAGELLEIPVAYGGRFGPDLSGICHTLGLTIDEFVRLHTGREYRVDMVGFTPGFAFIGGLDERLGVPRREEPRQRVAAGSIGIADGRTGVYAIASPGGWNVVGRTPERLFNAQETQPFSIRTGMRIRFVAIDEKEFSR